MVGALSQELPQKRAKIIEVFQLSSYLKRHTFFASRKIASVILDQLVQLMKLEKCEAGHTIFEYGSSGDQFYFILEGEVEV